MNRAGRRSKTKSRGPSVESSAVSVGSAARNGEPHPFGEEADYDSQVFDPFARELVTTWHSSSNRIFCLNSYPNGVTVSMHPNSVGEEDDSTEEEEKVPYVPNQFHLRLRETKDYLLPQGKYFLFRNNYRDELERRLSLFYKQGLLDSSVLYFGTASDPFCAFHKKFDVTVSCMELLQQYHPGRVIVQTRSPMVIAALPMLKDLGSRAVVAIPVETPLDSSIARYTPGRPRIAERLVACEGLRRQGIVVNLLASPVLPYGEFYRDAWDFAELLNNYGDYVSFGSLASGAQADEGQLKSLTLARKLVADKQFRYLRPNSYRCVYHALKKLAPEKLLLPVKKPKDPSQLDLFAA